jgi:hypothetical protein
MVVFDWPGAVQRPSGITPFEYFKKRAMPEFVEPLVTELVKHFVSCNDLRRKVLLSGGPQELSTTLGWYARKLAGRAVRDNTFEDLWNGLVGLALAANVDPRNSIAVLALYYNSAIRLKQDPNLHIIRAAKISTPLVEEYFTAFTDAPPDQRTIGKWGFSEGAGPSGFDYLPLMPEYGGPTPLD